MIKNNILEISKRASKGGRVPIKIALLKIHENKSETNKNGIHWDETFVTNSMDSAVMMPICTEFVDDTKSTPLGHGLTDIIVDNDGVSSPIFENSETVGAIESVAIETISDGENDIKVLVGNGVLYSQRYPSFVKWVRTNYATSSVDTSIEVMGLPENNNKIIYLEEEPTDEFRTPKDFLFSGTAILSLSPADDNAIVLEVAQKKKEEEKNMDFDMDELKSVIKATMTELNSNEEETAIKIAELNSQLAEKENVITQKNEEIIELNANVEQVQKALDDLKKEHETYWVEREALEKELGKLKAERRIDELNNAVAEFTDEEKKFAELEINSFNEDPINGDINAIVDKIYSGIGQASKKALEDAKVAEINSAKESNVEDIFSEMCTDTHVEEDEDINIF